MTAHDQVQAIGADADRFIDRNEFIARLRDRQIGQEHYARFMYMEAYSLEAEQVLYTEQLTRNRHPLPAAIFAHTAHQVAEARKLLLSCAAELGVTDEQLAQAPSDKRMTRCLHDVSWIGMHAGTAEAALFMRTDVLLWRALCRAVSETAQKHEDIPRPFVRYMEFWTPSQPIALESTLEVVDFALARGEDPEKALISARTVEPWLEMYWDYVINP
ncbi:hypothetical protein [Streptomyces huasconensis]|uniref:hypothetical protein n=1 Tax=Streptomyces huasconensis TaxID=1854574 RepID=UPI0036FEB4A1